MGSVAHPHRDPVAKCQRTGAANMVAMLVRDEYRVDVFGLQSGLGEARQQLPDAQPTIDEHPQRQEAHGLDDSGVSGTAAAKALESQHRRRSVKPARSGMRQGLLQVVGNHLHDALGIGRRIRLALGVQHGNRGAFALALDSDAVFQRRNSGGRPAEQLAEK